MFDHIGITVAELGRAVQFYRAALEPLGYGLQSEDPQSAGFGPKGAPQLWLNPGKRATAGHLALRAPDRAAVRKFHAAALAAGGRDNGEPGLRPSYGERYYAAFVLDPRICTRGIVFRRRGRSVIDLGTHVDSSQRRLCGRG